LVLGVDADSCSRINILTVTDDFPVVGGDNAGFVRSFQVRLVEAREDNMAVVWLKFSVNVFRTVSVVLEVLEALAVVDEV